MKTARIFFVMAILASPLVSNAQRQDSYKKKTSRKTTIMDTSKRVDIQKDPILKENAPVLNDNGNVNTSGTVDGSRSSTGRPGVDTTVSYTRKRKRTVTGAGVVYPDTTVKKNPKP